MNTKLIKSFVVALTMASLVGCAATETSRSTGQVVDDASIAAQVKTKLLADPLTDGLDIDVEVDRNRVQLNGFVDSDAQRDQAEKVAASVAGTMTVENNLRLNEGKRMAGEYIDDKTLVGMVKAALADDEVANALEIDVEVNRGVVSLGGFVESNAERLAAANAASEVNGVEKVINNLSVR